MVKSRLVMAFSRPPSAATCFENSPTPTLGVPLNIMCSSMWATPVVPLTSSMPPTRYQIWCATVGARWSSLTISRRPLASRYSVVPCAVAPAGAVCAEGIGDPTTPCAPAGNDQGSRPSSSAGTMRRARRTAPAGSVEEEGWQCRWMRAWAPSAPAAVRTAQWFMRPRLLEFCRSIRAGSMRARISHVAN
ncbi:hypothetical protein D9M72_420690 [compost metagenome]